MALNLGKAIQEGGYKGKVFVGRFNGERPVSPYKVENLSPGRNQDVTIMSGFLLEYLSESIFQIRRRFKTPLAPHLKDPGFNERKYLSGREKSGIEGRLP